MGAYILIIFFSLVFVVVLLFRIFFSRRAIVRRALKRTVVKHIETVREGEIAKIVGRVELVEDKGVAPLSGRSCAGYYVLVQEKTASSKNSHWRTIIEEEKYKDFVINDGTGIAIVNRHKLKSYIVKDWKEYSGFRHDTTPALEQYLNVHGFKSRNFIGLNKSIRYSEGVLEPGETVAALGKGCWIERNNGTETGTNVRVLELNSIDGDALYLSDDIDTIQSSVKPIKASQYRK